MPDQRMITGTACERDVEGAYSLEWPATQRQGGSRGRGAAV